MSSIIKIKKGLDIKIKGKAEKIFVKATPSDTYAIKPTDFQGLFPKVMVKPGDQVKAGSPLFFDKYNPEIRFTSPVSGEVQSVNRGERRIVLEIVVKADPVISFEDFGKIDTPTREEVTQKLLLAGLWPYIRQRPYNLIANPKDTPKSIFISGFDTAPLAPDYDFILKGTDDDFQKGIDALATLTVGKVHLNVNADYPVSPIFSKVKNVQINKFSGIHPTGNVGVQIHHIDPINKGDVVWVVNPQDVVIIGRLLSKGMYDASKIIALAGSKVKKPRYYKTIAGTSVQSILLDNVENDGDSRIISGNVLTGSKVPKDGHLGFYDNLITVIPEGNHYELLGWALPGLNKFSWSRTFFSWLTRNKEYNLDTNLNGGRRAFVMTGVFEKVFPFDIYPLQIIKAIIIEDIDLMERLGIYEVVEEDFALCEFVDTSKTEIQSIVRKGLDMMKKEMS